MTQITPRTLAILKNFTAITETGLALLGNEIAVQDGGSAASLNNSSKTIVARAAITENFEQAIYVANPLQLYSCLTSFQNPQVEMIDGRIKVSDSTDSKLGQFFLTPTTQSLVSVPKKAVIPASEGDVHLKMDAATMDRVFRGLAVVQAPEVKLEGKSNDLIITALDTDKSSSDTFHMMIASCETDFSAVLRIDQLNKLLKGVDYEVTISPHGITKFNAPYEGLLIEYYFASLFKR